jgi:hypothetical protein
VSKYQKTRQVILDLMGVLEERPENTDVWKLHIDLACDKIEQIWGAEKPQPNNPTTLKQLIRLYIASRKVGWTGVQNTAGEMIAQKLAPNKPKESKRK